MALVDRDDRRPAAAAETLDGAQGDRAVLGRLAEADAELALEGLDHALSAAEGAADVRADLDHVAADRPQVEHVVEGRDRLAVSRRQPERGADLFEGLGREPAVALLCEPERRQDRG